MLEITQPAVDDPRGTAGSAAGEIILFEKQNALAAQGTFARNGYTVHTAAYDYHVVRMRWKGRAGYAGQSSHQVDGIRKYRRPKMPDANVYDRMKPSCVCCGAKPGKTFASSLLPIWFVRPSPRTARKSVVTSRSRP